VEDMRQSIAAINGAELVGRIKKDLSPADWELLRELVRTHSDVDQSAVQAALRKCNEANSATLSTRLGRPFIKPAQKHHATADADVVITGTFPVSTSMDHETLEKPDNMTVRVMDLLNGPDGRGVLCNMMPTTLRKGGYTAVPGKSHFETFAPAAGALLGDLLDAGLQFFHLISNKNREPLMRVLHNPRIVSLLKSNGAELEMYVPQTGAAVLAVVPYEHYSHLGWGALMKETRLYLLEGLGRVHAAAAALLGRQPPRIGRLLELVDAVPHLLHYKGGAYCEAVMKGKLRAYIAEFGDEAGTEAWQEWYTGCKRDAGASGAPAAPGRTYRALACWARVWAVFDSRSQRL
jgi:hypothetical protein